MSWQQLLDIDQENKQIAQTPGMGFVGPPTACPNDLTLLEPGPPSDPSVQLFCPFDGWQYPKDWIAGM